MHMKKKLFLALSLLAITCLTLVAPALGQTRTVGVRENDVFIYTITSYWNSANRSALAPEDLVGLNNTVSYNSTVSTISGSNVTTLDSWRFNNGTSTTGIIEQDINSGAVYVATVALVNIVGANLSPNDLLYPAGNDPRRINQTVSVDYGSSKRDANAVIVSYPVQDDSGNVIGSGQERYYFDKTTGMLVARTESSSVSGENSSIVILLIGTNRWQITTVPVIASSSSSPPPDSMQVFGVSLPILVLVVVVIVLVVTIAYAMSIKRRRSRRRKLRR